MSEKNDPYGLMLDAVKRDTIIPVFTYKHPDMQTNDTQVPFDDFAQNMHVNAVNIANLLANMLEDLYNEFETDVRESHKNAHGLPHIVDILDEDTHSINEVLKKLSQHESELYAFTEKYEAMKELASLEEDAGRIADRLFYSKSFILDDQETAKIKWLFSSLKNAIADLSEIVDRIPSLLDVDGSLKDKYFSMLNDGNRNAINALSDDMHIITDNLELMLKKTEQKLEDHWSRNERFRQQERDERSEGHGGIG